MPLPSIRGSVGGSRRVLPRNSLPGGWWRRYDAAVVGPHRRASAGFQQDQVPMLGPAVIHGNIQANRRPHADESHGRSVEPGCAHASTRRDHRECELARRAGAHQETVEAQRSIECEIVVGKFSIASARCVLCAGRRQSVCDRPTTLCSSWKLEIPALETTTSEPAAHFPFANRVHATHPRAFLKKPIEIGTNYAERLERCESPPPRMKNDVIRKRDSNEEFVSGMLRTCTHRN